MELTFSSMHLFENIEVQKSMRDGPRESQYFWYMKGCIPLGPGSLEGLKKKTTSLISLLLGMETTLLCI